MKLTPLLVLVLFASTGTSDYALLEGRLRFSAPGRWREVRRVDGDTVGFLAFVVPRPRNDSLAPAGNVMIDVALSHRRVDLQTYSDAKLGQEAAGPGTPTIVDDTTWSDDRSRTVLSRGSLRGTPYVLWDKFAVRDSIYLNVRTAIPVSYGSDSVWEARYEADVATLLRSLCVGQSLFFAPLQ